jgi:hypothetical protein
VHLCEISESDKGRGGGVRVRACARNKVVLCRVSSGKRKWMLTLIFLSMWPEEKRLLNKNLLKLVEYFANLIL